MPKGASAPLPTRKLRPGRALPPPGRRVRLVPALRGLTWPEPRSGLNPGPPGTWRPGPGLPAGARRPPPTPASGSAPTCLQSLQKHELAALVVSGEAGEEALLGLPRSQPLGEGWAGDVRPPLSRRGARRAPVRSSGHAFRGPRRRFLPG